MRLSGGHILLVCLVALTLVSGCSRRGRVIPAGTFAQIYADMLIADQWLSDNGSVRRTADTTNFYAPVFAKYGYSFRDYDRSVNHYLNNPGKYARLLEKTTAILEKHIKELKAEEARIDKIEELLAYLRDNALPPVDFELDTLLWRPDSLLPRDSLAVADSLAAVDSLAAADTLAVADSVVAEIIKPDNVKRKHSLRPDSLEAPGKLLRHKPLADEGEILQL